MLSWILNLRRSSKRPVARHLNLEYLEGRSLLSASVLQTNLVSDLPGVAQVQDPNLVNPWGITESSGSAFWISDNNSGLSTLYNTQGAIQGLVVGIPGPNFENGMVFDGANPAGVIGAPLSATDANGSAGAPTGTVFNGTGLFAVTRPADAKAGAVNSASPAFLFATEDGTIAGWAPGILGTEAIIAVDHSQTNEAGTFDPANGAVYKGLALATSSTPIIAGDSASTSLLYASNFRGGQIDVFDGNFEQVNGKLPAGAFSDPNLPKGYAPFNVQELTVDGVSKIYVTYAKQDTSKHDDVAGLGHGFVDVYNLDGTPGLTIGGKVTQRLVTGGALNSPWGLAIAPAAFGLGNSALLVGNFGDGMIHIYDANTGNPEGQLLDPDGEPIQIDGLWALRVGNGGNGGLSSNVYFTAGIDGEAHGLFGSFSFAPPGTPEGPAEAQLVQNNLDIFNLAQAQLQTDLAAGAKNSVIKQDIKTIQQDLVTLVKSEIELANDAFRDLGLKAHGVSSGDHDSADDIFETMGGSKHHH